MTTAPRHFEALSERMRTGGVKGLSGASGAPERLKGETSHGGLIAAAHASCFAMALAFLLYESRLPTERVIVTGARSPHEDAQAPRSTTCELVPAKETSSSPGDGAPPAGTSPWSRSREEAEVERIVHALRGYGLLPRTRLVEVCATTDWSDLGFARALARAVSAGRVRPLGNDLYETTES